MLFSEALVSYLTTNLNVPVWANKIPQGATSYPALVYTITYTSPYYTLSAAAGLVTSSVQIDAYGRDSGSAEALAESVRLVLDSYRGFFGTVQVSSCRLTNQTSSYEPSPASSDQGWYRWMTEYDIRHEETIPTF